jgi:hypothetical protein
MLFQVVPGRALERVVNPAEVTLRETPPRSGVGLALALAGGPAHDQAPISMRADAPLVSRTTYCSTRRSAVTS